MNKIVNNKVKHPKHYNIGNIEVIDYIGDRVLTFSMGNVIKYIARCVQGARIKIKK